MLPPKKIKMTNQPRENIFLHLNASSSDFFIRKKIVILLVQSTKK